MSVGFLYSVTQMAPGWQVRVGGDWLTVADVREVSPSGPGLPRRLLFTMEPTDGGRARTFVAERWAMRRALIPQAVAS